VLRLMGTFRASNTLLDDHDYEACYREALIVLDLKMGHVEPPMVAINGRRSCNVLGFKLDDFHVFGLAWGRSVATEIENQRSAFLSHETKLTG
jgi:hypothetical protein